MKKKLAKLPKVVIQYKRYIDCDFILGSAAHVERLWSIAKYILTCQRSVMTPQVFEAILFLRENECVWDLQFVAEAIGKAEQRSSAEGLEEHLLIFPGTIVMYISSSSS